MAALTILYETHATTTDNEAGRASGWLPGELSELGRRQAGELGERIRDRAPDAVVGSDLARVRQTVGLGCAALDVPVFYDWRLRECHYGLLGGAPREQVHGPAITRFLRNPYPGGESWLAALDRVDRALDDLRDLFPGGTVVMVGHIATRWALRRRTEAVTVDELAAEEFRWRPGWKYVIS